jgi:hypothetical protein
MDACTITGVGQPSHGLSRIAAAIPLSEAIGIDRSARVRYNLRPGRTLSWSARRRIQFVKESSMSLSARNTARLLLATALLAGVAISSGCSSSKDKRVSGLRKDPTPDMSTLYQRQDDVDNALAVYFNEMDRMFWQDMGRAFYTDRPSRLTPEPMPR